MINGEEGLERAAEAVQRRAERIPEERICEPNFMLRSCYSANFLQLR